jgi:UDP-N-acetylglucosamine 1-carboxyvinyltransferase
MAMLATARGVSHITETIFERRFRHADELIKQGADITVEGRIARIAGVERLTGARVTATDVRAAAALVLSGLGAKGETVLDGLDHLDRGYDRMAEKLESCGARIVRSVM